MAALERRPLPGRVPHFELVFFLTMEVFGKVHPSHRAYFQWLQMSEHEKQAHRGDMAQLYIDTAERFEHAAILLHPNPNDLDEQCRLIDEIRRRSGDRYFLMLHGDATPGIPNGGDMEALSLEMAEEPELYEDKIQRAVAHTLERAAALKKRTRLDGFALCSDYCFNTGAFLPMPWFDRFVTPYLHQICRAYKEMDFYIIKHTDGIIMPILDRLVPADAKSRPHALHSLDPQGGVDMAEIVRRVGDKVALCGNVDCGKLQTGTDAQCRESAAYAITHGLQAPGYIFCTSNCVYTGLDLARYEMILDIWRKQGIRRG